MSVTPEWIVGFTDGEGCFKLNIMKDRSNIGFEVSPCFEITLHYGDAGVLEEIKKSLEVGSIQNHNRASLRNRGVAASDNAVYSVTGLKNCSKVKEFFSQYPLRSKKKQDFVLWCECLDLIQRGMHKTIHGFLRIIKLRDQMNIAGKARMIHSGRYRNYDWFHSKLVGTTSQLC